MTGSVETANRLTDLIARTLGVPARWLPIRRIDQVLFAEAFAQALDAGMDLIESIRLVSSVNPSLRFRSILDEMRRNCLRGYPLASSLTMTRARVSADLSAALRVGEDRGCLPVELRAFARRHDAKAEGRLARAVGRSPGVTEFAASLSRLLEDRPLNPILVRDAGSLVTGGRPRLASAIASLALDLENGTPFSMALETQSTTFDPLFCHFVEAARGREQLRSTLAMLGARGVNTSPNQAG